MRLLAVILVSTFLLLVDQSRFRGYYTGYVVWAVGYYTLQAVRTVQFAAYYPFRS
jgi:hypothetical protein